MKVLPDVHGSKSLDLLGIIRFLSLKSREKPLKTIGFP